MQQTNIAQLPCNNHLPMWVGVVNNRWMLDEWCDAWHRPNAAHSCRRRRDDSDSTAMRIGHCGDRRLKAMIATRCAKRQEGVPTQICGQPGFIALLRLGLPSVTLHTCRQPCSACSGRLQQCSRLQQPRLDRPSLAGPCCSASSRPFPLQTGSPRRQKQSPRLFPTPSLPARTCLQIRAAIPLLKAKPRCAPLPPAGQGLRSLKSARSAFHTLQAIATATATAIAQTAGSVKGGPGCSGQAQAQAEATVGGQPWMRWSASPLGILMRAALVWQITNRPTLVSLLQATAYSKAFADSLATAGCGGNVAQTTTSAVDESFKTVRASGAHHAFATT